MCGLIERVKARFEKNIAESETLDFDALAVGMIDYLKAKASGVAHKVTRGMAKSRALRLMEEVGIPEPRKRSCVMNMTESCRSCLTLLISSKICDCMVTSSAAPNAPDIPPPKAVTDRIKRMREKANAARGAATDETRSRRLALCRPLRALSPLSFCRTRLRRRYPSLLRATKLFSPSFWARLPPCRARRRRKAPRRTAIRAIEEVRLWKTPTIYF